jgi:hypothetical protein
MMMSHCVGSHAKSAFIAKMQEHGNPPDRWMWHELIKAMLVEAGPAAGMGQVLEEMTEAGINPNVATRQLCPS